MSADGLGLVPGMHVKQSFREKNYHLSRLLEVLGLFISQLAAHDALLDALDRVHADNGAGHRALHPRQGYLRHRPPALLRNLLDALDDLGLDGVFTLRADRVEELAARGLGERAPLHYSRAVLTTV